MRAVAACVVLLAPTAAGAQLVRGIVRENIAGAPVAGALVTLERADELTATGGGEAVRSVLSDSGGAFAVGAAGPGRFRVTVKRIGSLRFASDTFSLAVGETRRLDVALDNVALALPAVAVNGTSGCAPPRGDASRLASLWDDARAALAATSISTRDSLVRYRLVRYSRALDPSDLRVLDETFRLYNGTDGSSQPLFTSLSGDSLSRGGYWRNVGGISTVFYGPDAEALLSTAFVRDHCFTVVEGDGPRRDLVGLAFEPVRRRALPDIRGTLWLDARTSELRSVDFAWTRLPDGASPAETGGRVLFSRLAGGPWIVRRWFLRMPRSLYFAGATGGSQQPVQVGLQEDGGFVYATAASAASATVGGAAVTGIVRDSTGRPFPGVPVRLGGTVRVEMTDSAGRFAFVDIPAGVFAVAVQYPGYEPYGPAALGRTEIVLEEGARRELYFRAPAAASMSFTLCDGATPAPGEATLRVLVREAPLARPRSGIAVRLSWPRPVPAAESRPGAASRVTREIVAVTDTGGMALFCGVPARVKLHLGFAAGGDAAPAPSVFELAPRELRVLSVKAPPPQPPGGAPRDTASFTPTSTRSR